MTSFTTIRHKFCKLLISSKEQRCGPCSMYRVSLHMYSRRRSNEIVASINKNDRYLTLNQALEKLKKLEIEKKQLVVSNVKRQEKIRCLIKAEGIEVDANTEDLIMQTMKNRKVKYDHYLHQLLESIEEFKKFQKVNFESIKNTIDMIEEKSLDSIE